MVSLKRSASNSLIAFFVDLYSCLSLCILLVVMGLCLDFGVLLFGVAVGDCGNKLFTASFTS